MHALASLWANLEREFDSAVQAQTDSARWQLTSGLNDFVRRLRAYKGEAQWASTVADGAAIFCKEIALFSVTNNSMTLLESRSLSLAAGHAMAAPYPHAFAAAVQSRDTVVALRTAGEVGVELARPGTDRAALIPIGNEDRVVAILASFGCDDRLLSGMELVASLAGMVLERRANSGLAIQPVAAPVNAPPAWGQLSESAQTLHVRAQRFARVRVAEIQLANPEAASAGREQRNLYLFLKAAIDEARDAYQSQFMRPEQVRESAMLDYLHLEFLNKLADGDESRLGDEYPGPLQ